MRMRMVTMMIPSYHATLARAAISPLPCESNMAEYLGKSEDTHACMQTKTETNDGLGLSATA